MCIDCVSVLVRWNSAHCVGPFSLSFRFAVRNKNPFAWNGILGEYDRGVTDGHEKLIKVDTLIVHSGFNQVGTDQSKSEIVIAIL